MASQKVDSPLVKKNPATGRSVMSGRTLDNEEESCLQIFIGVLRDGSNTLRSFFGTNILTMAWAFSVLGAMLGPIATMFAALIVYRATLSLIRVKQSLPHHEEIVTYGGVVSAVAGNKGQIVVDMLVAFTQFTTCISYAAFSSKNLHSISGIPMYFCVLGLVLVVVIVSLFHNPYMLAKISIVTNMMMFSGIGIILTTIDFGQRNDIDLFIPQGLPIGMATLSSSLGGITTVLDVERTMTHRPGRYLAFLRGVLPCVVVFLSAVGVMGYMTFGADTCAVLSLSIKKGSWQHYATQAVLTLGPCLEGVLNSFPLFVITEKYCLNISCLATWAESHPQLYFYAHRVFWFIPIGLIAYGVPFIGYLSSLNGAIGYASLSFLVPIVCEYLRSKKTDFAEDALHEGQNYDTLSKRSADDSHNILEEGRASDRDGEGNHHSQAYGGTSLSSPSTLSDGAAVNHGIESRTASEAIPDALQSKNLAAQRSASLYAFNLPLGRKIELGCIMVFGITVVILGTIFAVKDIVAQLDHTAKKAACA